MLKVTNKNLETKEIFDLDVWCHKCDALVFFNGKHNQIFVCNHIKVTKSKRLPTT